MKIAVLGAGNGGHALAGDLSLRGHEVTLWENPKFEKSLDYLREHENKVKLTDKINTVAKIAHVTTDIESALKGAEVIYCIMPSFAQEATFDYAVPYIEPGQTIFIMPGNFGSISLYMRLKARGIEEKVLLGESDTIPYAARMMPDHSCLVFGLKDCMSISAIPAVKTNRLIEKLKPAFPIRLFSLPDIFSVALSNTNMILHCPTMVLNTGRIEFCERFRFYNDGMTPSVCRVMEAMDKERLAVGRAWGCQLVSEFDDAISNYALDRSKYNTLHDIFVNHPVYGNHGPDSPITMKFRYVSEDVPYLLVPVSEMGDKASIATTVINSIINIAGVINNENYRESGRGLKAMGLNDMSIVEVMQLIKGRVS